MGESQQGPFKIILTELEAPAADVLGNPAQEASVVERYHVASDGTLQQEMILTDPVMLEEPWVTRQSYDPYDVDLLPFECELRERPPARN